MNEEKRPRRWIFVEEKRITRVQESFCETVPKGALEVSIKHEGLNSGQLLTWHNFEESRPKTTDELVEEGLIEDHRGTYYHTETKDEKKVLLLGEPHPGSEYTQQEPLDSQFQNWDGQKWVEDEEAKLNNLKERKRELRDSLLSETDKYMVSDFPKAKLPASIKVITAYRNFLRELPNSETPWWEEDILTIEEYIESH